MLRRGWATAIPATPCPTPPKAGRAVEAILRERSRCCRPSLPTSPYRNTTITRDTIWRGDCRLFIWLTRFSPIECLPSEVDKISKSNEAESNPKLWTVPGSVNRLRVFLKNIVKGDHIQYPWLYSGTHVGIHQRGGYSSLIFEHLRIQNNILKFKTYLVKN